MTNAIIIMDGYGNRDEKKGNAIAAADTKNFSAYKAKYPHTLIEASGRAVGLPTGQMGNSEVGHLNLGAGRVVYQDITKIDSEIEDGEFFNNAAFIEAFGNAKKHGTAVHLMGLLSDGGVHSHINHLFALLKMAKQQGVSKVFVHCIMDGRDVPPDSGNQFIAELEKEMNTLGVGKIASVVGRYYIMDRDNRWERVEKGYNLVFNGEGIKYTNANAGVAASYALGIYDEFIEPIIVNGYKGVKENDSIIFFNFRSDRAREISRAILNADFNNFDRKSGFKKVCYVGMTTYDATFTGIITAYPPRQLVNTLGEYLANIGKKQARIAETEKYAHVTFFFNGGVEEPNKLEERVLIPSPKVATYDLQPEMSAYLVADAAVKAIENDNLDVLILNFANCDMVGHTGILSAATKAVSAVDECLKKVVDKIQETGGTALITADHGNAELMAFDDGAPCTSHTTNKVPFIVAGDKYIGKTLVENGALCDVAPTLLTVMGVEVPKEMTGKSLID